MKVYICDTKNEQGEVKGRVYLESDTMQFIIKEYTGKTRKEKDGSETELFNTLGYVTDPEAAMRFMLKLKIKESTAADLKALLSEIREIKAWLHEVLGL